MLDIVTADYNADSVSVFLGTGGGSFASRISYAAGNGPESLELVDLNGDGFLDFVTTNALDANISVGLGRGDGTFDSPVAYSSGSTVSPSVQSGDFNGDGVSDIAVSSLVDGFRVLLSNTQDGVAPLLPFSLRTLADTRQALPVFARKREQLAAQRGEIGAFQSRIEVARNVLEVSSENFKAAESRIRDADIADESSRLVRLNILQQAASAVLAQANQQPQIALALLG